MAGEILNLEFDPFQNSVNALTCNGELLNELTANDVPKKTKGNQKKKKRRKVERGHDETATLFF